MIYVVTGGQTGVDRAALDTALAWRLPVGGWCPLGRRAEDGRIAARYPLKETPLPTYAQRTAWNVRDSDGTLILGRRACSPGTNRTFLAAEEAQKPLLRIDLAQDPATEKAPPWLAEHKIKILNIAGPRESEAPGIYTVACKFLDELFGRLGIRRP